MMYSFRKIVASIGSLGVFLGILHLFNWAYLGFQVEWLGILVIIFTLKTRICTWMYCKIFYLKDGTAAYSRLLNPNLAFTYMNYTKFDSLKLKILKTYPLFMDLTDYKHGAVPHGLNEFYRVPSWWRRVYPATMIQLAVGYCIFMGYYSDYYKELFVAWAVACVIGMLISMIEPFSKIGSILHNKIFVFRMNVFDLFYYLSFGYTRRSGIYPIRIIFSFILLGVTIVTYLDYTDDIINQVRKVVEEVWVFLLRLLP